MHATLPMLVSHLLFYSYFFELHNIQKSKKKKMMNYNTYFKLKKGKCVYVYFGDTATWSILSTTSY